MTGSSFETIQRELPRPFTLVAFALMVVLCWRYAATAPTAAPPTSSAGAWHLVRAAVGTLLGFWPWVASRGVRVLAVAPFAIWFLETFVVFPYTDFY